MESFRVDQRDEPIAGEMIRFILMRFIQPFHPLNKKHLFTMLEDMSRLVKKSKPEMIVGFKAQAKRQHGFVGEEPLRRATHRTTFRRGHEDDRDAILRA